jgi:hypothetical protein
MRRSIFAALPMIAQFGSRGPGRPASVPQRRPLCAAQATCLQPERPTDGQTAAHETRWGGPPELLEGVSFDIHTLLSRPDLLPHCIGNISGPVSQARDSVRRCSLR